MDSGGVRSASYHPIERIDFANEVALAKPANGWVATHGPDLVQVHTDQSSTRANARRGASCLHTSVTTANYKNIELIHRCRLDGLKLPVKANCFT